MTILDRVRVKNNESDPSATADKKGKKGEAAIATGAGIKRVRTVMTGEVTQKLKKAARSWQKAFTEADSTTVANKKQNSTRNNSSDTVHAPGFFLQIHEYKSDK